MKDFFVDTIRDLKRAIRQGDHWEAFWNSFMFVLMVTTCLLLIIPCLPVLLVSGIVLFVVVRLEKHKSK